MSIESIIAGIEGEIETLQSALSALRGSTVKRSYTRQAVKATTKRVLSPSGRKAISDALKKRWAEKRKPEATKKAAKKASTKKVKEPAPVVQA